MREFYIVTLVDATLLLLIEFYSSTRSEFYLISYNVDAVIVYLYRLKK